MLAVKLARAAAQAEKIRIEALARRQVGRVIYAIGGLVFAGAALAMIHVLAEVALAPRFGTLEVSAGLLGLDVVLAALFGVIAANSKPGRVEAEAQYIRRRALGQFKEEVTFAALAPQVFGRLRWGQWLLVGQLLLRIVAPKRRHRQTTALR